MVLDSSGMDLLTKRWPNHFFHLKLQLHPLGVNQTTVNLL